MGRQSKANVRAFFETGDRPTQQQFEDFIDSVAWGNGTALGVVEIESTNSSTILSRGSFGAVWLGAASTASALGHLGITSVGAVGNLILSTIATASALGQLGITSVGAVGNQLLGAIATASAINHLGAGTFGVQMLSAAATASAQRHIGISVFGGTLVDDTTASAAQTTLGFTLGTWTPTLGGSSTNPVMTYSTQAGWYMEVGNMAIIYGFLRATDRQGGTGDAVINGLPFTVDGATGTGRNAAGIATQWSNINLTAGAVNISPTPGGGSTRLDLNEAFDAAVESALPITAWASAATVFIGFFGVYLKS